jgi:hypothetical protein
VTLKRERTRPVDWKKAAQEKVAEEERVWSIKLRQAVSRRTDLFIYLEENVPAKKGKRNGPNQLGWYISGKKIPWAPKGFLG